MTFPRGPTIHTRAIGELRYGYTAEVESDQRKRIPRKLLQQRAGALERMGLLLAFGTFQQQTEDAVDIKNFQGIYLSPQQAKALMMILEQNVANYEKTFGEIKLDPRMTVPGIVN